jgi:hypothetical protein
MSIITLDSLFPSCIHLGATSKDITSLVAHIRLCHLVLHPNWEAQLSLPTTNIFPFAVRGRNIASCLLVIHGPVHLVVVSCRNSKQTSLLNKILDQRIRTATIPEHFF